MIQTFKSGNIPTGKVEKMTKIKYSKMKIGAALSLVLVNFSSQNFVRKADGSGILQEFYSQNPKVFKLK